MKDHTASSGRSGGEHSVDCAANPTASLLEMFVGIIQAGRIAKGQCPALRPVFLKPHGVARGVFHVRPDLPEDLKIGLFAGSKYPAWVRFSSDTLPTLGDYGTTVGMAIKFFDAPVPKIFGEPEDTTFDLIFQNFDVFFVDDAAAMCSFTQAGVIAGDYGPYLAAHPETAALLNEMAKPATSTLASTFWSCLPFAFGVNRYVKYKLEPTLRLDPPGSVPQDPSYLAADLRDRLKENEACFKFYIQFSTDPEIMPLDRATVRWSEVYSPPVHVADLILFQQDITARGQAEYGENLSFNIWRVTDEHRPQGSLAEVRRTVYEASAKLRRDTNGIPTGEPDEPRPAISTALGVDSTIVRAAIHPAIGIARMGDSLDSYFIGPEVADPAPEEPGFYRDNLGALKRQAARFRIYGHNAAGDVVRELTPDNADIEWTVHLANKKAAWYQFQAALDIPDASGLAVPRRNGDVSGLQRQQLIIDPGPRSIAGISAASRFFDTGKFKTTVVPLGEIRTDETGRLLVLGGFGKSASPSNAPIYNPDDPTSFNNANDWYDDASDGSVTAEVSLEGKKINVEPAWVVVAPPNYAPNIVGWRTMFDLLTDLYVQCGWMELPDKISFARHVLPVLGRLTNLQWVNKGFASFFGKGAPLDFTDKALLYKLSQTPPTPGDNLDPYAELRLSILNAFRPPDTTANEPRMWPWMFGDAFDNFPGPNYNLKLPALQQTILKRWAHGDFINDWSPDAIPVKSIDQMPVGERPSMLDEAALHFCLADAFHPGCEMTWPMRHSSLYTKPFRIRHRHTGEPEPDYGSNLTQSTALSLGGPLYAQRPGDLTRWMAIPWQGDTAFCRSTYEPEYNPYLPTYWPARVPNQILTEDDYKVAMDTTLPREQRIQAFNHRPHWIRALTGSPPQVMLQMVAHFSALGIVEARPGIKDDPDFPETLYVESLAGSHLKAKASEVARFLAERPGPLTPYERAGWESQEQFEEFRRVRFRRK